MGEEATVKKLHLPTAGVYFRNGKHNFILQFIKSKFPFYSNWTFTVNSSVAGLHNILLEINT